MTEIWALSATALAAKIRDGEISAGQAALAALERLGEVNPRLNAVVAHRPEEVLAQAAGVDAAIARGEDPGPLAGVPVTVKVNIDQAGFATTNGVRAQEHLVAHSNSPVIDNLRRAGAVILGRTNTPAFSLRWFTSNLVHGATKNPRDARLTPGGSSGGAARRGRRGHRPLGPRHGHRRLHPLPGLCVRRARPAPQPRPRRGL